MCTFKPDRATGNLSIFMLFRNNNNNQTDFAQVYSLGFTVKFQDLHGFHCVNTLHEAHADIC
jgi:hypothetical protein